MDFKKQANRLRKNCEILDRAEELIGEGKLNGAEEIFNFQKENGYYWTPEEEAKNIHDIEQGKYI